MKPTLPTEAKSEVGLATRCQGSSARLRPASLQAGSERLSSSPKASGTNPVIFRPRRTRVAEQDNGDEGTKPQGDCSGKGK